MGRFSIWEILVILILVAIIFGGKRLPELGRGLGKGLANFRGALKEDPDGPGKGAEAQKETGKSGQESSPEDGPGSHKA
jgi:sec-independent protein translocase protein TatA